MPVQSPALPKPKKIEAVLFDYGLVLTGPPHPPAWERMKSLVGADEAAFHTAYWRPRHDYDCGALGGQAYWQEVAKELGQNLDEPNLGILLEADTALWTQPNTPMITWAAHLQAAGVRTGILSNLGDAMEDGVRRACPWLSGFHHLTFSHRLGIAKPDLAIYQHAADGLDAPPGHILFIDDREDNIEGARRAGMQTLRYTNHAEFEAAMRDFQLGYLLAPATKV